MQQDRDSRGTYNKNAATPKLSTDLSGFTTTIIWNASRYL